MNTADRKSLMTGINCVPKRLADWNKPDEPAGE
jgi:hypothetical protein